jgi:retron-type reverse transcriptase
MAQMTIDFNTVDVAREVCTTSNAPITLEDLFQAYYDCRKNKRRTSNALKFELNYEENLWQLCEEINTDSYQIGRSVAFIVNRPVKREIFAAGFRDRVIHHLLINKLQPLFEKEFIYDSYSCRKGKGTLFGVKRLSRFIRSCSENYTKDCYALKIDIQGFFMSIRRPTLQTMLRQLINSKYTAGDRDILLRLMNQVVTNDCVKGCLVKCPREEWAGLPANKSLFKNEPGRGLPIGNLTSQIFANYYLTPFDHFIKSTLGLRYYARYVDDCLIVHPDKGRG